MELNESDLRTLLDTAHEPVVALFSAKWCGPCRMFAPIFAKTSEKYSKSGNKISFAKMDVDECTQLCEDLNISVVPTIIIFKDAAVLQRREGGFPTEKVFEDFINSYVKK